MEEKNTPVTLESKIFIEEQIELNEVAASFGTTSSIATASCPGSSVGTLSSASTSG